MASCCIDHLVVTAPTLEAGAEYIKNNLGVEMQPGGRHPAMGTWNLLLSLGDSAYLEVISIAPAVPAPDRPRWFGLDHHRDKFAPTFSAWVARTTDIHSAVKACPEALGDIVPMTRGDLHWYITIPPDGMPPLAGAAPALIEWPAGVHPAERLKDRGLRLQNIEIRHPQPDRVQRLLSSLNFNDKVELSQSADGCCSLHATIHTPQGPGYLVSHLIK